jgi:hypothetical protein
VHVDLSKFLSQGHLDRFRSQGDSEEPSGPNSNHLGPQVFAHFLIPSREYAGASFSFPEAAWDG